MEVEWSKSMCYFSLRLLKGEFWYFLFFFFVTWHISHISIGCANFAVAISTVEKLTKQRIRASCTNPTCILVS